MAADPSAAASPARRSPAALTVGLLSFSPLRHGRWLKEKPPCGGLSQFPHEIDLLSGDCLRAFLAARQITNEGETACEERECGGQWCRRYRHNICTKTTSDECRDGNAYTREERQIRLGRSLSVIASPFEKLKVGRHVVNSQEQNVVPFTKVNVIFVIKLHVRAVCGIQCKSRRWSDASLHKDLAAG